MPPFSSHDKTPGFAAKPMSHQKNLMFFDKDNTSLNLSLPQPRAQSREQRTPILPTRESFKHKINTHPDQYLSTFTKSYSSRTKTPTLKVSFPSHLADLASSMKVDLVHIAIDDTPTSPTYKAPTLYPHADIHTVKDTPTHLDPSPSSPPCIL